MKRSKQTIRINESRLRNIIKESIRKMLNEADYDINAAYHGPYGNRSQYAPTENDGDAVYSYEKPGQLSMLAQTPFKAKGYEGAAGRWARNEKFKSVVPKSIEEFGIPVSADVLFGEGGTPQENVPNSDDIYGMDYVNKECADILRQIAGKRLQKDGDYVYIWDLCITGLDGKYLLSRRCFRNEDNAERDATNTMKQIMKLNPKLSWEDFEDSGVEAVDLENGCISMDRVLVFHEDTGWMD